MVGVAEELLRLATFTTEFDIKAVIADRAAYCFEVVCEHVRGPHIGEPQRRQLGDDLVEYNKFDVSKQCKDCVDLHNTWSSLDKQSSITVSVISQVLQWIGDMYLNLCN